MFTVNKQLTQKTIEQIKFDTQLLKDFIRVETLLREKKK
tara:strand:+ start:937 stop:1053 length:117 start_codon:yes stop_codon:yes gene_type:complete